MDEMAKVLAVIVFVIWIVLLTWLVALAVKAMRHGI
jgi:hypothetical protein